MIFDFKQFPLQSGDWEAAFGRGLDTRARYQTGEGTLIYEQVAGAILGSPWEPQTYRDYIYKLAHETPEVRLFTSGGLDAGGDGSRFPSAQKLFGYHYEGQDFTASLMADFLDEESLLPLKENLEYYGHLRSTFAKFLQTFETSYQGFSDPELDEVLTNVLKWSWNHLKIWVEQTDYKKEAIAIAWYGSATKSEATFLCFLADLGLDVLAFHPEGRNIFMQVKGVSMPRRLYPRLLDFEPIPPKRALRESTIAKQASTELDLILHQEGSYLFKPWQFRSHIPESVTLHTTYDEVRLITREKAFIRPSFEVQGMTVHVPVVFAKIAGVSADRGEFALKYEEMLNSELVVSRQRLPFSWEIKEDAKPYLDSATVNGVLDPERMMAAPWWKYRSLSEGLQRGLAYAISRYVAKAQLRGFPGEDVRPYLLSQALELPKDIILMLQKFDYSQDVPMLVVFNDGKTGDLSRWDAARLLLLNEFGMDIVIFTPSGSSDVEMFVEHGVFDVHWEPEMSFDLTHEKMLSLAVQAKKPSMKRLFSRILK